MVIVVLNSFIFRTFLHNYLLFLLLLWRCYLDSFRAIEIKNESTEIFENTADKEAISTSIEAYAEWSRSSSERMRRGMRKRIVCIVLR